MNEGLNSRDGRVRNRGAGDAAADFRRVTRGFPEVGAAVPAAVGPGVVPTSILAAMGIIPKQVRNVVRHRICSQQTFGLQRMTAVQCPR